VSLSGCTLTSEIAYRFPAQDHAGAELDKNLTMFVFPNGFSCSDDPVPPSTSSFAMTESDGTRVYGVVLLFPLHLHDVIHQLARNAAARLPADLTDPDARASQLAALLGFDPVAAAALLQGYLPHALVLTSHFPFYAQLAAFLRMTFQLTTASHAAAITQHPAPSYLPSHFAGLPLPAPASVHHLRAILSSRAVPRVTGLPAALLQRAPLERLLSNLIFETPLPPQGRVLVENRALFSPLVFARPPPNKPPLRDFSLAWLFTWLSTNHILTLFAAAVTERKLLFVSTDVAKLNIAAESLLQLLFPLYWRHIYIPVLPAALTDFLCAPMPFICGVHADCVPDVLMLDQVLLVDLDNDTLTAHGCSVPELPEPRLQSLLRHLRKTVAPDPATPLSAEPYDVAQPLLARHTHTVAADDSRALARAELPEPLVLEDVALRYDPHHALYALPQVPAPCPAPSTRRRCWPPSSSASCGCSRATAASSRPRATWSSRSSTARPSSPPTPSHAPS
jgi:hypothetical protein